MNISLFSASPAITQYIDDQESMQEREQTVMKRLKEKFLDDSTMQEAVRNSERSTANFHPLKKETYQVSIQNEEEKDEDDELAFEDKREDFTPQFKQLWQQNEKKFQVISEKDFFYPAV